MRTLRAWPAILAVAVAVAGCGGGGSGSGSGDAAAGRRLFVKERCGGCHALRALHAKGGQGPSFDMPGEKLTIAQVHAALVEGANGMPSYRRLGPRRLDELTAFVRTVVH